MSAPTFFLMSSKSEKEKIPALDQEFSAKLFVALNDLAMALATCESEEVRKSEVYQTAQEVIKVLKSIKRKSEKS
ncbi:hypothetical protein ARV1_gp19 [Acidianus rod-shaped virus 1]|uniref:Uncharacterized protein n=1 Tax=Acidianus rod-shaped virus 1 TaxID=309181 RepID=Q50I52_9VIRU|nr:hypothetical protein ARV1_gp19 [Acidianus rod-shaped virus 1]CAI44174.1 hypothetical protein [Acidianus rod-shaped virus 1]